jgi:hypothetical protein
VKNNLGAFHRSRERGSIGEFAVGPRNAGQSLRVRPAAAKSMDSCAMAAKFSAQMGADKATTSEHKTTHAAQAHQINAHG